MTMTWISDKPTKPGWYWFNGDTFYPPQIVSVQYTGTRKYDFLRVYFMSGQQSDPLELNGKWSGPLTPPED